MRGKRAKAIRRAAAAEVADRGWDAPMARSSERRRRGRPLAVILNPFGWTRRRMKRAWNERRRPAGLDGRGAMRAKARSERRAWKRKGRTMNLWAWGVGLGLLGAAGAGPSATAQTWRVPGTYPGPWGGADLVSNACLAAQFHTSTLAGREAWEARIRAAGGYVNDDGAPVWLWICTSSTDLYDPPASRNDCPEECWAEQGAWRDESRCGPNCLGDWMCGYEFAKATDTGPVFVREGAGFREATWIDGLLGRTRYVERCGWPGVEPPERPLAELPFWVVAFGQRAGKPLAVVEAGPDEIGLWLEAVEGAR